MAKVNNILWVVSYLRLVPKLNIFCFCFVHKMLKNFSDLRVTMQVTTQNDFSVYVYLYPDRSLVLVNDSPIQLAGLVGELQTSIRINQ